MRQYGALYVVKMTSIDKLTVAELILFLDNAIEQFQAIKTIEGKRTRLEVDARQGIGNLSDDDIKDIINEHIAKLLCTLSKNPLDYIEIYKPRDGIDASLIFTRISLGNDKGLYLMHHQMRRNMDYVAYGRSKSDLWELDICSQERMASTTFEESLYMLKKLYTSCNNFFIPTKIDYSLSIYQKDFIVNDYSGLDVKLIRNEKRTLTSKIDLVSWEDFVKDIEKVETPEGAVKLIWEIKMEGNVKIFLEGFDGYINRESLLYMIEYDDFSYLPSYDPMHIEIELKTIRNEKNNTKALLDRYILDIKTYTDIWVDEDTNVGRVNGERLISMFKRIYDNFNVIDTFTLSELSSLDKLNKFLPKLK